MDPYSFVFFRFLVSSLTLTALALATKNLGSNFRNKRLVFLLGVTNGLAYLLQFVGMVSTLASTSSLLVNLSVVWVALISTLTLNEGLEARKVASLAVSLVGIFFVTTNLDFTSLASGELAGNLLVTGAGILWAIFIVYNKLLAKNVNQLQTMTLLSLFTLAPLLPVAPFAAAKFSALTLEAWVAIAYTGIFCWIIPYYIWTRGLNNSLERSAGCYNNFNYTPRRNHNRNHGGWSTSNNNWDSAGFNQITASPPKSF